MYVPYRNVYILYIQYIYILQVQMSTNGIVKHYIGWYQSPKPQKYTVLNENYMCNVCNIFHERNPSVKWDLPAYRNEAGKH
jgi:hypothetical protein